MVQVRTQERLTKLQRLTAGLKAGKSMEESLGKNVYCALKHMSIYMYVYNR